MAKKKRIWTDTWTELEAIDASGGQGRTYLVESTSEPCILGCLKELKNDNSAERRGRFRREAVAAETLDHPSIPKILDHNSKQYQTDERLYIVAEFVPGTTILEAVKKGLPDFETAVQTTIKLLDIVGHVHSHVIFHRDIKPNNIILREGSWADPVLVDFGLSFIPETSFTTPDPKQQLGNRFLHLPELQSESNDKSSPVSDVTQILGVLFFMMTGEIPVNLRDEKQLAPHQRFLDVFEGKNDLLHIFDIGFDPILSRRWQSCDALSASLRDLSAKEENLDIEDEFSRFANRVSSSPEITSMIECKDILREFIQAAGACAKQITDEVPHGAISFSVNQNTMYAEQRAQYNCYFKFATQESQRKPIHLMCRLVGNELLLEVKDDKEPAVPVGRINMSGIVNWEQELTQMKQEIKKTLLEGW